VANEYYDFVHSSHSLEHMIDPVEALVNWIRVLKPGGHLIITVPDEDMYEHGIWPSVYNQDHKWSFTIAKQESDMPKSLNVVDLMKGFSHLVKPLRILLLDDFYNPKLNESVDQTMLANAECAIEIVCQKL
jgi:ubiquinone/menaquinone biosynthesis C-methylase UbiE